MSKYYVYTLADPRDNKIFYIGKGTGKRMYRHISNVRNNNINSKINRHLYNKLKQLISENLEPIYNKIIETDDEQLAYYKESQHILKIGLKNICNLCTTTQKGGPRVPWSIQRKQYMSDKFKGEKNPFYGKTHTDEVKNIVSENNKKHNSIQRLLTKEVIQKRVKNRIANGTNKHSIETKLKMSIAKKGKIPWNKGKTGIYSEQSKQKMIQSHIGQKAWNKGLTIEDPRVRKYIESKMRINDNTIT